MERRKMEQRAEIGTKEIVDRWISPSKCISDSHSIFTTISRLTLLLLQSFTRTHTFTPHTHTNTHIYTGVYMKQQHKSSQTLVAVSFHLRGRKKQENFFFYKIFRRKNHLLNLQIYTLQIRSEIESVLCIKS